MISIPIRRCAEVNFVDAAPLMTTEICAFWLSLIVCCNSGGNKRTTHSSSLQFLNEDDDRRGTPDFGFVQSFSKEEYMWDRR